MDSKRNTHSILKIYRHLKTMHKTVHQFLFWFLEKGWEALNLQTTAGHTKGALEFGFSPEPSNLGENYCSNFSLMGKKVIPKLTVLTGAEKNFLLSQGSWLLRVLTIKTHPWIETFQHLWVFLWKGQKNKKNKVHVYYVRFHLWRLC